MIKVIVVTKNNQRIITKFGRKLKKAKRFRKLVKECGHAHIAKVCLVDDSEIKAPEKGLERIPGHLWCPYCGKQRQFKGNYRGDDYQWCEVCQISDSDFHVKSINSLWTSRVAPDRFFVTTQEDRSEAREEKKEKRKERAERRRQKAEAEAAKAAKKPKRLTGGSKL